MGHRKDTYTRKSVECPFYKKENTQVVYCAGIEENSSIHVAFGNATDCKIYKDTVCGGAYKKCRVFCMLEEVNSAE